MDRSFSGVTVDHGRGDGGVKRLRPTLILRTPVTRVFTVWVEPLLLSMEHYEE